MTTEKRSLLKEEIISLLPEMENELTRILDFWSKETLDQKYGGYVGRIDFFGRRDEKAVKGVVLYARLLWTFSAAYHLYKNPEFKEQASRAYNYLVDHFWDKENGGLYWSVNYSGETEDDRKQAYAQAFCIYAFSEYYRATERPDSLLFALQLYHTIEKRFKDKKAGGYIEALNYDWSPREDMRLSEKDLNSPKSMNTHLHILESYTNLYRNWPNIHLKHSIIALLDVFKSYILNQETGHYNLFFNKNWSVMSDIVSYGHDIEGAWLMHEAAKIIGKKNLIARFQNSTIKMVDTTIQEGYDIDGAVFNELHGKHLNTDKDYWPQAEAMVGFMDAWEISKNDTYLEKILQTWTFIKDKLIDQEKGEWFLKVNRAGKPYENEDKAGFWKCPYHNSRALMELIQRIQNLTKNYN